MFNIILYTIILTLIITVAYLKSKLNIAEYKLNSWRQTALQLNSLKKNRQFLLYIMLEPTEIQNESLAKAQELLGCKLVKRISIWTIGFKWWSDMSDTQRERLLNELRREYSKQQREQSKEVQNL